MRVAIRLFVEIEQLLKYSIWSLAAGVDCGAQKVSAVIQDHTGEGLHAGHFGSDWLLAALAHRIIAFRHAM